MGLSYDPGSRKWDLKPEQESFERKPVKDTLTFNLTGYYVNEGVGSPSNRGTYSQYRRVFIPSDPPSTGRGGFSYPRETITITVPINENVTAFSASLENALQAQNVNTTYSSSTGKGPVSVVTYPGIFSLRSSAAKSNQDETETNKRNTEINTELDTLETQNKAKNAAYKKVLGVVNSTQGGDYVEQRKLIRQIEGIDEQLKGALEKDYKAYYSNEKLQPWDSNLGAKPPYGTFDPGYYETQNPVAAQKWQAAVDDDDIDITQRYELAKQYVGNKPTDEELKQARKEGFYLHHYTTQGKPAGARGNEEEKLAAAEQYVENKPTDEELKQARTIQLGVNTDTQTERLLRVPEVAAAWEAAKAGDSYWKAKGKEFFLDPNKKDEFAVLFRMSDRPEDKEVAFKYNINADYGITELEDALNAAVGEKAIVDVKRFGALTQNVLKDTIDQMKKAKAKEQELAIFSGFDSFGEITNINKDLTNSILGDSGIGGVLSFMGGDKAQKSLEKSLRGITGINNEVTYNWQQWFDDTLKKKYQEDIELGLTKDEAQEQVKIQGQFARDFIDKYLIPRFNESRSMNEFVEYLDVRQSEQNPFQTQDILDAVKVVADTRAELYIEELRKTPERYFNAEFYFNPSGDKAREGAYATQAQTVNADWEAAKNGDPYWASQAYRFGVDINDKDAFARMHFQVKGQGQGYDPADDILTASKVSDYIYSKILPALNEKALAQGTVFGQFLRPEEFADEMLKGLNPEDKKTWDEVLEKYGLESFGGTLEDLKKYITESVRTGSAQEIREQIKYLNEKREKPTQEILGVSYIQREEDYKPKDTVEGQTELYKTFQSAGFQGTEDEFYENFFPDLDRSEQVALTKAGTNQALKTTGLDFSDPFASLGTIESFFGEGQKEEETKRSSYFTIDEDEELPTKTKAGQGFLDEFTSMFKGFS